MLNDKPIAESWQTFLEVFLELFPQNVGRKTWTVIREASAAITRKIYMKKQFKHNKINNLTRVSIDDTIWINRWYPKVGLGRLNVT